MTPTDQVRALEAENQHLRDALTAEQDKRRKWQGALNRAEDIIKRELRRVSANHEEAHQRDDTIAIALDRREAQGLSTAIDAIRHARKETHQ